jgi:hypothetical protein
MQLQLQSGDENMNKFKKPKNQPKNLEEAKKLHTKTIMDLAEQYINKLGEAIKLKQPDVSIVILSALIAEKLDKEFKETNERFAENKFKYIYNTDTAKESDLFDNLFFDMMDIIVISQSIFLVLHRFDKISAGDANKILTDMTVALNKEQKLINKPYDNNIYI